MKSPLAAVVLALFSPLHAEITLKLSDFGVEANSGKDATAAMKKAVEAAKASGDATTLLLDDGRYDFFPADATRRKCYYSNATEKNADALRTLAMDFSGLKNFNLKGSGHTTLMMHGAMTMVAAENASGITLSGLEFDFARPSVSEITALEKGGGYWIGQVHPDSRYTLEDGGHILWKGEDWQSHHDLCQTFDPGQQTTWRSSDPTSKATAIEDLGERKLKFSVTPDTLSKVQPGMVYQFRNVVRDECGMWFSRCRDVTMSQVQVRAMRGFGILCQFTENVSYDHLEVGPRDDSGRTACAAADVLHFSGCRGTIRITDSKLGHAHDDALNVHGVHLKVVAVEDEGRKLTVRFGHEQTWGFQAYVPGDEIEFVKPQSLRPFGGATVTAVDFQPGSHEQTLTLDRPAPQGLELGKDVIENVTWTPEVQISHCEIGQVPTRGFLLTTRRPVVIRDCRFFRTEMSGVLVEDDAANWFESGPVRDLTLEGNVFYECKGTPVQFSPQNTVHDGPVHEHVRVLNNEFVMKGDRAMDFKSTSDITITGNRFVMENGTTPTVDSLIRCENVAGFHAADNRVEAK